jgi:hypothetical protein
MQSKQEECRDAALTVQRARRSGEDKIISPKDLSQDGSEHSKQRAKVDAPHGCSPIFGRFTSQEADRESSDQHISDEDQKQIDRSCPSKKNGDKTDQYHQREK